MPTDTLSAQQLWKQTNNYRRLLSCEMPKGLVFYDRSKTRDGDSFFYLDGYSVRVERAAAILRDHGDEFLIQQKCSPEYGYNNGLYYIQLSHPRFQGRKELRACTKLEVINAAIGAVLDEREGK